MNKQQLASKIWAGANELRGKVSAAAYKDYMLGLIFYKYISEKEENHLKTELFFEPADIKSLAETDEDTKNDCCSRIGYFISGENLFSSWIANGQDFQIKDIRTALSAFDRLIGKNYKKVYDGIFLALNNGLDAFGNIDSERTKAIRKLINLINDIPTNGSQDYDVLGFVYEFLLKNFAANAGKAGEFYTPFEASSIMSEIIAEHLKDRKEISIYDPTSGSGSLLINIGKSVSKKLHGTNKIAYYAQELIPETFNLTRMNLIMRDIIPANIIVRNGDTLAADWPYFDDNDKERTYDPLFVDGCCSNPPYSQPWDNDEASSNIRFKDYGVAPKSKADYAFLLHNLYHLKPDGIMTIVMPHGVLFRGGDEGIIREHLIEKHNIETIIGLPEKIFFGTGISTIIMVLKKHRTTDDVLFIDASKGYIKDGNKNKLRAKDIRKIVDTVINRNPSDKDANFARLVTKKEIEENQYNLNIPRYIDSNESSDKWDIYATMFGGIPNSEISELDKYWVEFPSLKNELFKEKDIPYCDIIAENINEIINANSDVVAFINAFEKIFSDFPLYLKKQLIDNFKNISINKEESVLSGKIQELFSDLPLVDYYDAYQLLDDCWNRIALDIETLQLEGAESLKQVDANIITKKNGKTKETYEIQDGWVGHLLPFDLIQQSYFSSDKVQLDTLIQELVSLETEKNELLDSIDPNDKTELLKDESEDIESKKLNAVITKIKNKLKKGAEYEENSYEDIIIKINAVNENSKANKKALKKLKTELEEKSKNKIENLSDDEALQLLTTKWVTPLCNSINQLPLLIVKELGKKVLYIVDKYKTTFLDVNTQITESEKALSTLIDDLTADEFDLKGLAELQSLLGGAKND